jgi:integrase
MGVTVREVDGAWWVFVNHQGRRKAKRIGPGDARRKAAHEAAAKIQARLTLGDLKIFEADKAVPTVKAVADEWTRHNAADWKRGTLRIYDNLITAKIIPAFGPLPITALTPAKIEEWWTRTRETGLCKKSLANLRRVLSGICQRALVQEYVTKDPSLRIAGRLGRSDAEIQKRDYLTPDELTAMLASAERVCPRFAPALAVMATAGLRLGEAIGLQVGDLDVEGAKIHVRRSVGRGGHIGSPKNGTGRVVAVPDVIMVKLAALREIRQVEAAVDGREARWLFPGDLKDRPLTETPIREALRLALKAAGIRPVKVHGLRHTYATLAIQSGVDLLNVSRQLGHANIGTTADTYTHAVPGGTRAAAEALGAILTRPAQADARPAQVGAVSA